MSTNQQETFGDRVRKRRAVLNITAAALSSRMGVSGPTIHKLEKGGRTRHLVELANALETTEQWLTTGEDERVNEVGSYIQKRATKPRVKAPSSNELATILLDMGLTPIQIATVDCVVKQMIDGEYSDKACLSIIASAQSAGGGLSDQEEEELFQQAKHAVSS